MSQPTPGVQQIGNLIRHWVHYDNTIAELNKKVKSARETRNNYESQVLQMLKDTNMANPVIQINGGRLIVAEEKQHAPLTFTNIESLLHQFYAKRPGSRDDTADIIKFIKANRETTVTPCLKRQGAQRSRSNTD
jgi:hypothetical protein